MIPEGWGRIKTIKIHYLVFICKIKHVFLPIHVFAAIIVFLAAAVSDCY